VVIFHVMAAPILFISCIASSYDSCAHAMLRLMYAAWASFYMTYGIYELALVRAPAPHSCLAALCLVFAVCTLLFGVGSSMASERELERQERLERVVPDG